MTEEYPWPEKGDRVFEESSRPGDPWIHPTSVNFISYADSYKEAADELVKSAAGSKVKSDTLIFPILYLYRHHIELQMKFIIRTWRRLPQEEAPDYKHHRLRDLWQECRSIIEKAFPEEENRDVEVVENVVHELAESDPGSFTFRYPVDKDDEPTIEESQSIDLANLYEVMAKTSHFFDGAGSGVYEQVKTARNI